MLLKQFDKCMGKNLSLHLTPNTKISLRRTITLESIVKLLEENLKEYIWGLEENKREQKKHLSL